MIAISAAMGAVLINPARQQLITNDILTKDATNTPLPMIVLADLAAGTLCGLWNGLLVSQRQNSADGRDAHFDGGGTRHCPVDYKWSNHDHLLHALFLFWQRVYFGAARLRCIS